MIPALSALYNDLDLEQLRFRRPSKFVFLCGGLISDTDQNPVSLRDYLYRIKDVQSRLADKVVLAETATRLYKDTNYNDLISFEEDIARIASIVLVIPESPGSLAELGAFATNDTIRHALRVVMQARFENDESFIRFRPIEKVMTSTPQGRELVGFYPWRVTASSNHVLVNSVSDYYQTVIAFIEDHLAKIPSSTLFVKELQLFYVVYWVINILFAVSITVLYSCVTALLPEVSRSDIINKIYCMRLAGWVEKIPFDRKDYYYTTIDDDPFDYRFKAETKERDSFRRKSDIARVMQAVERRLIPLSQVGQYVV